jgi:hypothetical protein
MSSLFADTVSDSFLSIQNPARTGSSSPAAIVEPPMAQGGEYLKMTVLWPSGTTTPWNAASVSLTGSGVPFTVATQ